ncbi:uncharacterized protein LOC107677180 isoform X2 [Sinocyclocheilus anshuiensis]|uniref:uncharacterized protein LOC107677180 isoform X2 n=1 Tax=Sinocyclocheilus anshuiensis TaxID=1608454 RepID=UPI0007B9F971|nr:PREDICTED: uncharacterized protein LOC107677180 isoform X2 [Sinocyclocheilus anshuiensis]
MAPPLTLSYYSLVCQLAMPASRKCVLPGCDHLQNSSVSLFKFPKNDDIKKRWIKFVKRHLDGELRITTNTRLCSEHFTPDSFINFHRRELGFTDNPLLLVNGAEPTISRPGLHPPVPPTSGAIVGSTCPPISETVRGLSLISQDFNSEVSEEEMDHCYASTAETIQALSKKRKRTDVKRERDRLRQKNRVNIGEEYSRWKALKVEKGMKNDMEVACYLLDRVCGEHLSQDNSSESPRKRGKRQKSTSALKSETRSDSPQPSPDLQSTNVEVLGICYDVPPLWLYQPDKQAQPERLLEDGSDPDVRMGYNKEQNCMMEQSSSSSTTTEEDHTVLWEKRKDELTQTALRLEERLNAMRSLSDTASDPISLTRGIADQKERKWVVNKSSLTGLFRTCHQCGEPVLEFKTLTSGSLIRIQWECSKGHLMWLFPNHNPT